MTELQYTILEASNDDLITFEEASMMLTMYESGSFGDKVKKAWEAFKKWVKEIIDKITKKVAEFKEKIFGKKEAKVTVKSDPKKVKNLLKDVNSHLKPTEDFNGSFWEKIKGKAAIAAIVGVAGGAVTITAVEAHKHAEEIRDQLIQLNNKLQGLKWSDKLNPGKLIEDEDGYVIGEEKSTAAQRAACTILRGLISFAQSFLVSLLIITSKNDDAIRQVNDDKSRDSSKSKENLDKWKAEVDAIRKEFDKIDADYTKVLYSKDSTTDQIRSFKKKYDEAYDKLDAKYKEGYDDRIDSTDAIDKRYDANEKLYKDFCEYRFDHYNSIMRSYIVRLNILLRKAKKYCNLYDHTGLDSVTRDFKDTVTVARDTVYGADIGATDKYLKLSDDDRKKYYDAKNRYIIAINDLEKKMSMYKLIERPEED